MISIDELAHHDCPDCQGACLALGDETSVLTTLRSLQRDPYRCPNCDRTRGCRLREAFRSAVIEGAQVVGERWNLVSFAASQPGDLTCAAQIQARVGDDPAWREEGGGS